MATDTTLIQGEVIEDPSVDTDVEKLLVGFLRSLLDEQTVKSETRS